MRAEPMQGHLPEFQLQAGFLPFTEGEIRSISGVHPRPKSGPTKVTRLFAALNSAPIERREQILGQIERGEVTDFNQIIMALVSNARTIERLISTSTTALPIRENLEAEAKDLIPRDTPVRNRLKRTPGSGLASLWRQLISLGGGWDPTLDQPGAAVSAIRAFFAETGAPAEHVSSYAAKSAGYKLMGTYGSVTGFAAAAGNNFMNQIAQERTNSMRNLILNEENALINAISTSTALPWGDGTNALAFDGLLALTSTANGTPSGQVQTGVGALTFGAIDEMLRKLWNQGGQDPWILMNSLDNLSIVHLATASSQVQMFRIVPTNSGTTDAGLHVENYIHPVTGQSVPLLIDRFMPVGTILFGNDRLADGSPAIDVDVLPQVELPALAPNQMIQGYTLQDLAPTTAAPQVYPWIISVYQVLRMKAANAFGKMTGVTAV